MEVNIKHRNSLSSVLDFRKKKIILKIDRKKHSHVIALSDFL